MELLFIIHIGVTLHASVSICALSGFSYIWNYSPDVLYHNRVLRICIQGLSVKSIHLSPYP